MSSIVSFLARDAEDCTSQELAEPARVLGFAKPNVLSESGENKKALQANPPSKNSANRGIGNR
jgi:hypothetical protein